MRLKSYLAAGIFGLAGLSTFAAHAAEYPARPINMVVPFAAGGPTDSVARALAEAMRPALDQTVIIENKGGAGGTLGTSYVARANPDGYTVLLMHIGFSTAPSLYKNPGYKVEDLEPIGLVVDVPMTIIARSDFPPNNIQEYVEYVRANKDKVSLANAGVGAASHLCGTMLMSALGLDLLTVPYGGTAPAMKDLLGKQVDTLCDQTTNTTAQITGKTVKAYAVTSLERVPTLPDLPTMDESGYKGFQVGIWHGFWAPKGTPQPVLDKLQSALQTAMKSESFQKRMTELGARVMVDDANPQALTTLVQQQVPQWEKLFKDAGVEPQ
ncbi:tripartite tricarboxylate transporter substrate binding protein BugD [Verticiella sediminum]|uniref:Tripartite tricarboxylate transporter substrate binding protein BugD n=1 Tax=Verticiella sediminum TaxID=1247510 RepID=A0A556A935_9BURK|nr:tripartite tricarboxylate transporter substrate binding protein BugD [Verticiella sediminum]TSH89393.1 tripartite tricarboxylate transporter substrate binding protein BugD [Verticiella sediminum]